MINRHYDDCYFSNSDGYNESKYIFIEGNNLEKLFVKESEINVGETGFGSGLNLLVLEDVIETFFKDYSESTLNLTFSSVEKYPLTVNEVSVLLKELDGVTSTSLGRHLNLYNDIFSRITTGWNQYLFRRSWGNLTINIFIGDVLDSFQKYPVKNRVWFLDGHSPSKNPDMWNNDVFNGIADNSNFNTTLATFTAAGVVKQGLRAAGFTIKRKKGFGVKRHMIIGLFSN